MPINRLYTRIFLNPEEASNPKPIVYIIMSMSRKVQKCTRHGQFYLKVVFNCRCSMKKCIRSIACGSRGKIIGNNNNDVSLPQKPSAYSNNPFERCVAFFRMFFNHYYCYYYFEKESNCQATIPAIDWVHNRFCQPVR